MGMIPQEQALVRKFQGRPFAMLGVCSDAKIERGQETAKVRGMDWPCWFDGQGGPIVGDYNVLGWPAIYILDERGMIAEKDLRGEELDAKISELMASVKTGHH